MGAHGGPCLLWALCLWDHLLNQLSCKLGLHRNTLDIKTVALACICNCCNGEFHAVVLVSSSVGTGSVPLMAQTRSRRVPMFRCSQTALNLTEQQVLLEVLVSEQCPLRDPHSFKAVCIKLLSFPFVWVLKTLRTDAVHAVVLQLCIVVQAGDPQIVGWSSLDGPFECSQSLVTSAICPHLCQSTAQGMASLSNRELGRF